MKRNKYSVRLLKIAEDDLYDIVSYIAVENKTASELIAARIEKALTQLAVIPYLGRIPNEEELAQLGYRFIVIQNYLIFYTVKKHTVLVHRIIHGARDYFELL